MLLHPLEKTKAQAVEEQSAAKQNETKEKLQ